MQVFISYASEDKVFVDKLVADLTAKGLDIWIDRSEISVSDSLITKISSGLSSSDCFIPVLSPHSISSAWVKREISYALTRELETNSNLIYPILLDNCDIPPFLRDKAFADFRNNYDSGFEVLMQSLSAFTPPNSETLIIEDIGFLLSEENEKLCMEAVLSNQTLSPIFISKVVIQSKVNMRGLGSSPFLLKASYKVRLPGGISHTNNTFTGKVFEDIERNFAKPCSGSLIYENSTGSETWCVSVTIPVSFRIFAKDKLCLRVVFEKPRKKIQSVERKGTPFGCISLGKISDETTLQLFGISKILAQIVKMDISDSFIEFVANN